MAMVTAEGEGASSQEVIDPDDDFSRWYSQVVRRAKLADFTPVRGSMAIMPYGYSLWENLQQLLDRRLKESGHVNAYFPLLLPEGLLQKDATHGEGFAPQAAWVTLAGDQLLEERYCLRPTSEAIVGALYSRWIDSWRDLPVLINQWCNSFRWEKVTRLFLRTAEFLWQEGHTAHRTAGEAEAEVLRILDLYRDFIEGDLAIPVLVGEKSASGRFPGAARTFSVEALMRDGRALQVGTAHDLGQHFARAFGITFQDQDGQRKHVWQTSWGVSTRLIGSIVMAHGDEAGLVLPPNVAPVQAVIVPIWRNERERAMVLSATERLLARLKPLGRVVADTDDATTPGWKFNEWELRGVPLRIEIGPRDVQQDQVVLVRRQNRQRQVTPAAALPARLPALLLDLQAEIFQRAFAFRQESTRPAATWDDFREIIATQRGFVLAAWCGAADCERAIQAETTATLRCLPLGRSPAEGGCVRCGSRATERAVFAKGY